MLAQSHANICARFLRYLSRRLRASRPTQQREPSDNAGTNLIVLGLGVAVTLELGCLTEQATSEPRAVSLSLMRNDLYVQTTTLCASASRL